MSANDKYWCAFSRLTKTGAVAGKRDVIKSVQKFLRRLKQAADKKLLNKSK